MGILGIVVVLILPTFLSNFIFALSKMIDSDIVSERLNYVAEVLAGNQEAESFAVESRLERYVKPLTAFVKSFGFGVWSNEGSGGHSFVFDNMGCYGYIGIVVIIIFFKGMFKYFIRPFKYSCCYGYMLWGAIMALGLMVLNPKTNIFYLGCILILFGSAMDNKERKNEFIMDSK